MKLKESDDEEDLEEETDDSEDAEADDDEVETDNVGDASVEINVEELIHELEVQSSNARRQSSEYAAKRRLEELMEMKRAKRELEDFEDYDI